MTGESPTFARRRARRMHYAAPRFDDLERRCLLATIAFNPSDFLAASATSIIDNKSVDAYQSLTNLNQAGQQSITATTPYATESVSFNKNDSSFQLSATGHLTQISGDGDFGVSARLDSPNLTMDLVPDDPSETQAVRITVSGSYDVNGTEQNLTFNRVSANELDVSSTLAPFNAALLTQTLQAGASGPSDPQFVKFDIGTSLVEAGSESLNLSVSITTLQPVVVAAQYNSEPSTLPNDFGPYVIGIPLQNLFTATPDPAISDITKVTYHFLATSGGGSGFDLVTGTATKSSGKWTFQVDVGGIETNSGGVITVADALQVDVTATSGGISYEVASASESIATILSFNFKLTANDPGEGLDVSKLRFITGVTLTPTFTETITNLPSYYANDIQQVQLQTFSPGAGSPLTYSDINVDATPLGALGVSFSFSTNVGNLFGYGTATEGVYDSPVYPLFTTESGSKQELTTYGAPSIQMIYLPSWMGANPRNVQWIDNQYVINFAFPSDLEDDFLTSGTPFGLFDDLESEYDAGIDVTVTANLTYADDDDAQAVGDDVFVDALLLDQQVLDAVKSAPGSIELSTTLNPLTLEPSNSITIKTTQTIDLTPTKNVLFDRKFGLPGTGGAIPFNVPSPIPLSTSLGLSGEFKGTLDHVGVSLQLNITVGDGNFQFGEGSFVEFDAAASAVLQLNAGGGIGFAILPDINFINAVATGAVGASVALNLHLDVGGSFYDPNITLDQTLSSAGIAVATAFDYEVNFFSPPILPPPAVFAPDDVVASTGLFGLPKPPLSSFGLTGPGNANSPAIPGVPDNGSTTKSTEGPAAPVSTLAVVNHQGKPPTSTLTANALVFGPIDDVQYDVDVLADHAALTSGHHYLDTVLIAADGSEVMLQSQDLAAFPLQTNANPLGYSSGWVPVSIDLTKVNLLPAEPYQLAFLLTNDRSGTGQAVEVVIDNVAYVDPKPKLVITSSGAVPPGSIDLSSGTATVNLANSGTAPLEINSLAVTGTNATLVNTLPSTFDLLPGTSLNLTLERTSANIPVAAMLAFATNDPDNPTVQLTLVASLSSQQPTTLSNVSGSGTYGGTTSVSAKLTAGGSALAGQLVTFSLEIGGVTTPLGSGETDSTGTATFTAPNLAGLDAGTYHGAVQASFTANGDYQAGNATGDLTVSKAVLLVTADDEDMAHGGTVPALRYSISGFVDSDNASVVAGAPTLSTTATSSSPAGIDPISVSTTGLVAANYTFSANSGNLTVHPAVVDVLVQWGSRTMSVLGINRDLPFTTITAIDIVFSDNVVVSKSDLSLSGTSTKNYVFSGFSYNAAKNEGTWALPSALGIDHLMLALDGTSPVGVHTSSPVISLLNNDTQKFAVLPGDFNGDGIVNSQDTVAIRNEILGITPATIWGDLDGTDTVDLQDYLAAQKRLGTHL